MGSSSKEPLHFERSEIFLRNLIQWYSLTLSLSLSHTHTHTESTPFLVCKRDSQRDTQFLFSIKLVLYVYISFLLMNMMVKDMWKWIMGWKVIGIGISRIYISHSASKIGVFMWMADCLFVLGGIMVISLISLCVKRNVFERSYFIQSLLNLAIRWKIAIPTELKKKKTPIFYYNLSMTGLFISHQQYSW